MRGNFCDYVIAHIYIVQSQITESAYRQQVPNPQNYYNYNSDKGSGFPLSAEKRLLLRREKKFLCAKKTAPSFTDEAVFIIAIFNRDLHRAMLKHPRIIRLELLLRRELQSLRLLLRGPRLRELLLRVQLPS